MSNVFDILQERGFVEQCTYPEELRELLGKESVTFYVGFDATANSLTLGHLIPIMAMIHMQQAGHKPIVLLGGATTMVGDPSGKTDMRKMMSKDDIAANVESFREQFGRFLDLDGGGVQVVNNLEWFADMSFLEFVRDIGRHFSVSRMLAAECYKSRLETGLTFLEFSYMLMQSYDFLQLYRRYNCRLQIGGNDQWSNILGGYELVRREENAPVYAMTMKLLTTSTGKKMGKTEAGTVWLDPERTSPYELYQYLRNVDDQDVENCLALLTLLPMDEVRRLGSLKDAEINRAKEVLAYEVTKLVHGEEEADKAQSAARALFGGTGESEHMPSTTLHKEAFERGMDVLTLLTETGLAASRSEGRRLVQQGGVHLDGERVESIDQLVTLDRFRDGELIIKKGKKVYHKVILA
jgi:tyrosyl-tRNA synthetase